MKDKVAQFEIWKDEIDIRIENWRNLLLSNNLSILLDYSVESLNNIELFLIDKYTIDNLSDSKYNKDLDGVISYIGESLIYNIPQSQWVIYTDDKTNIFYNLPCVKTTYSGSFSVHYILRDILNEKTGEVLNSRINKALDYDKYIREHLKK